MSLATWLTAVFMAVVATLAQAQIPSGDDLGCFPESKRSRLYTYPPGDYSPSSVTPDYCRYKCQKDGFTYAAVTMGKICFCGRSAPTSSSVDTGTNCNVLCAGDASQKCGGQDHVHVYKTPVVVKDLSVNDPASQLLTYQSGVVEAAVAQGASVTYEFDYGDNTMKKADAANNNAHNFRSHGRKEVLVKATDVEGNSVQTSKKVEVVTEITGVDLSGPEAYEVGQRFEMLLSIATGSGMSADLSYGNSDPNDNVSVEDSKPYTVGIASGLVNSASSDAGKLYLMPNDIFHYDAKLMGFDYHIKTAGSLTMAVFRPTCASDQQFCFRSYSCISNTQICSQQNNRWSLTCSGSNKYSLSRRACVDPVSGAVGDDNTLMPSTDRKSVV